MRAADLMKAEERGDRRWFVNGQGQTFAIIEGPLEFLMGLPPTEPERCLPRPTPPAAWSIPGRFAIADQEVTIEHSSGSDRIDPDVPFQLRL